MCRKSTSQQLTLTVTNKRNYYDNLTGNKTKIFIRTYTHVSIHYSKKRPYGVVTGELRRCRSRVGR